MEKEIVTSLITFIAGIITAGVTIGTTNKKISSDLDFVTDWRKDLSKIASKSAITLDDVYTVRAKLRFEKHIGKVEEYSFKHITNIIIDYLEQITSLDSRNKVSNVLNERDSKMIRLFCMYLLKIQWENRGRMAPRSLFLKIILPMKKDKKYGEEFIKKYDEIENNRKDDGNDDNGVGCMSSKEENKKKIMLH